MTTLTRRYSEENGDGVAFFASALNGAATIQLDRDFAAAVLAAGSMISGRPGEPSRQQAAQARAPGEAESGLPPTAAEGLWVPREIADSVERELIRLGYEVVSSS